MQNERKKKEKKKKKRKKEGKKERKVHAPKAEGTLYCTHNIYFVKYIRSTPNTTLCDKTAASSGTRDNGRLWTPITIDTTNKHSRNKATRSGRWPAVVLVDIN